MHVFISSLPVAVLVAALVIFKAPAWRAALAALASGVAIASMVYSIGMRDIAVAAAKGVATGIFPIGLVIVAALFTYAVTVESGAMAEIKSALLSLSPDKRFLALAVVWGFGNFMEGMAGFGTAVAIPCAILVGIGFNPLRAVLCCLAANTTPTAFGSVGVPAMVLSQETSLGLSRLSATIAILQIFTTALLPFLILFIADGMRGLREKWRLAVLADAAFLVPWFFTAFFLGSELPNIVGGISVMTALALTGNRNGIDVQRQLRAWMPFGFVVAVLGIFAVLPQEFKVSPGILIFFAALAGGMCQKIRIARLLAIFADTCRKYSLAVFTICAVLALAKIMGVSGMTKSLASFLASISGSFYPAISPVVGALGGFVTGSGTSSNVLFGAMQAAAGTCEGEKFVFAAANVMGAGIGKMISPQSIVLGAAAAGLAGRESDIMKRALPYFLAVLAASCAITAAQAIF